MLDTALQQTCLDLETKRPKVLRRDKTDSKSVLTVSLNLFYANHYELMTALEK